MSLKRDNETLLKIITAYNNRRKGRQYNNILNYILSFPNTFFCYECGDWFIVSKEIKYCQKCKQ